MEPKLELFPSAVDRPFMSGTRLTWVCFEKFTRNRSRNVDENVSQTYLG